MKTFICLLLVLIVGLKSSDGFDRGFEGFSSRIFNGEVVERQPYFAYIQGGNGPTGGGAFITRRHVLTIARLLQSFTQWQIGYNDTVVSGLTRVVSTVAFIHPAFVAPHTNNIGIIVLPQLINSAYVQPISLPLPASVMPLPRIDEEGTVVGFSVRNTNEVPINTANLRAAYLLVRPPALCSGITINMENLFCAQDEEFNANVCTNNIGSPFVTSFRGKWILTGILTQFQLPCTRSNFSVYVSTQNYLDWIQSVANID